MPYALKRTFISKSQESDLGGSEISYLRAACKMEIQILSEFTRCPNLVSMIDHQEVEKKDGTEVFILLQYCPNGNLFDLIEE